MCGIAGFVTSSPRSELDLRVEVTQMASQLTHRGPDDCGVWADSQAGVGLGHSRLSILDLSAEGHQPMASASGRYMTVFNGEIYNFRSLRLELESMGHHFRGRSDTEVLLSALEQWGIEDALPRFNGMFALAVWDGKQRHLHLSRDRMGEKPLYYGWMGKSFLFGSELKALVAHSEFRREINRDALALYLRYGCVPQPHSIYRGIFQLPPASRLTLKPLRGLDSSSMTAYWSIEDAIWLGTDNPFTGSAEQAAECLDNLLRDAVNLRTVTDVPLGAFLSGGIDSSTLVALMQLNSAKPVRTFSIGFSECNYNEAECASAVARRLGTDHTEFYVTAEDAMRTIPLLPSLYDEPFADSSEIPTYLVSALARRHVTVSLSGDGGDEIFGGYRRYLLWGKVWEIAKRLPSAVRTMASRALRELSPEQWSDLVRHFRPALADSAGDKLHRLARLLSAKDAFCRYQALVSSNCEPSSIMAGWWKTASLIPDRPGRKELGNFVLQMMYLDLLTFLPNDILAKVDRASMAVGLETRAPYLDHRIVEFAARLPIQMKVRDGEGKWLLRRVLARYLPAALTEHPKKGFAVPIAEWLRGPLRGWAEELLREDRLRVDQHFQPRAVRNLWDAHVSGRRNLEHELWGLLMFQSWLEHWGKSSRKITEAPQSAVQPQQRISA